nr:DUF6773 family protein [uncultured Cellulosilyticum sp.]
MMKKNNLDEMQEQHLLKIEHYGMWFAFWALFASIFIQILIGLDSPLQIAGEAIILLLLSFYILFACIRNGIWDRRLKPNAKTNFITSLIAGIFVGVFNLIQGIKYGWSNPTISTSISAISTFIVTFTLLQLLSLLCKKRQQALEERSE